jgi:hypothetical protein
VGGGAPHVFSLIAFLVSATSPTARSEVKQLGGFQEESVAGPRFTNKLDEAFSGPELRVALGPRKLMSIYGYLKDRIAVEKPA